MYDTLEQLAEAANARERRYKEKLGKKMNLRRQAQRGRAALQRTIDRVQESSRSCSPCILKK